SALVTHGLPAPFNLQMAQRMEKTVREEGAVPAIAAVLEGVAHLGLAADELALLASHRRPQKVSLRDLPTALGRAWTGGTTVAATMHLAHRASVRVFATGGIGGIHRSHLEDVSADLTALATIPLTVVCAGAKAILDLPRTLEALETRGVSVVGYGTDVFPAFTSRFSGLQVPARADTPHEVVSTVRARDELGLRAAVLVCVPVPLEAELPFDEAETEIEAAVLEAEARGVGGRDLTPFLLAQLSERTEGRSREANEALLVNNARVAARIACALVTGE
ncbi:MAG: pseudouridine-5'-phosphate glycosidase, partial [Anaerolineae bacterium]